MIQQILYLNLDRRPDRNEWFLENMEAAGVPMEIVERVPAKDWRDYSSVQDTLIRMNREDGFAQNFFASTPQFHKGTLEPDWRGRTAYAWTMSKALKRIIETCKLTLVLHDDCSIISWDDLTSALSSIKYHLNVVQLSYDIHVNLQRNVILPYNQIWNYGIQTFREDAIVYSFTGASRMLSLIQGTHEHVQMVESMLLAHFNNLTTFHPVDRTRFIKTMEVHNPRDIFSDDMLTQ